VAEVALLGRRTRLFQLHDRAVDRVAGLIENGQVVGADGHQIALFEVDEAVGHLAQRQRIGGDEVFTNAHTDHQRTALARPHQQMGLVAVDHTKCKGSLQPRHRAAHRLLQIGLLLVGLMDQVHHHFGVGFGVEAVTLGDQFAAQCLVVLDDAVVHQRQPLARHVRMGIRLIGLAMGRPAGVGDADHAGQRHRRQRLGQILHLALTPMAANRFAGWIDHRNAGGVIAAVFEATQPLHQNLRHRPFGHGSNDSTHGSVPLRGSKVYFLLRYCRRRFPAVDVAGTADHVLRCSERQLFGRGTCLGDGRARRQSWHRGSTVTGATSAVVPEPTKTLFSTRRWLMLRFTPS
jgi:hypothetical protein